MSYFKMYEFSCSGFLTQVWTLEDLSKSAFNSNLECRATFEIKLLLNPVYVSISPELKPTFPVFKGIINLTTKVRKGLSTLNCLYQLVFNRTIFQ